MPPGSLLVIDYCDGGRALDLVVHAGLLYDVPFPCNCNFRIRVLPLGQSVARGHTAQRINAGPKCGSDAATNALSTRTCWNISSIWKHLARYGGRGGPAVREGVRGPIDVWNGQDQVP